jgi:hypothetical protein
MLKKNWDNYDMLCTIEFQKKVLNFWNDKSWIFQKERQTWPMEEKVKLNFQKDPITIQLFQAE